MINQFIKHGCKRYFKPNGEKKDTPIYWLVDNQQTTVASFSDFQEPVTRSQSYIVDVFNHLGMYNTFRDNLNNLFGDDEGEIIFISGIYYTLLVNFFNID